MAMNRRAAVETVQGLKKRGELEGLGPNAYLVLLIGVELVTCSFPRDVRKELNAAVKMGRLGHLKKDGHKPEAYFHPNSRDEAIAQRNAREAHVLRSAKGVLAINHGGVVK